MDTVDQRAELQGKLTDSGTGDAARADKPETSKAQEAPEGASRVDKAGTCGWLSFWSVALLASMAQFLCNLVIPDIATAFFAGGFDSCVGAGAGSDACHRALKGVSGVGAVYGAIGTGITLLCAPFIGSVTDSVGSNYMIRASMVLGFISVISLLSVVLWNVTFYISMVVSEFMALLPARMFCQIWLAEHTNPSERLVMFARLGAVFGMEKVGASIAAQFTNLEQTVLIAAGFQAFAMFASFGMPGMRRELRVKAKHESVIDMSGLKRLLQNRTCQLILLIVSVGTITESGCDAVFMFYCKEKYGADFKDLAAILMVMTISSVIIQVFFASILAKLLGVKGIVLFCSSIVIVAMSLVAIAPTISWMYVGMGMMGITALTGAAMKSLLVNITTGSGGSDVGASLGILASAMTIPYLVGPLVYRVVFFFFIQGENPFPEAVWCLSIALMIFNIVVVLLVDPAVFQVADRYQEDDYKPPETNEDQAAAPAGRSLS